jgi:hypothetical protein
MPQVCSICKHAERSGIESALASGASLRDIARQFGAGKDAVARHRDNCIKPILQEAKAQQDEQTAFNTISEMEWIREQARSIYQATNDAGDYRLALAALGELRRQNELRAKLEGELDEHSITITSIPEWQELRALLLDALSQHPQAKMAVIRALEAYDRDERPA